MPSAFVIGMVAGVGSANMSPRDQINEAERLVASTVSAAARRACSHRPVVAAFIMMVGMAPAAIASVVSILAGDGHRFQKVDPRRVGLPKAAAADHIITSEYVIVRTPCTVSQSAKG